MLLSLRDLGLRDAGGSGAATAAAAAADAEIEAEKAQGAAIRAGFASPVSTSSSSSSSSSSSEDASWWDKITGVTKDILVPASSLNYDRGPGLSPYEVAMLTRYEQAYDRGQASKSSSSIEDTIGGIFKNLVSPASIAGIGKLLNKPKPQAAVLQTQASFPTWAKVLIGVSAAGLFTILLIKVVK